MRKSFFINHIFRMLFHVLSMFNSIRITCYIKKTDFNRNERGWEGGWVEKGAESVIQRDRSKERRRENKTKRNNNMNVCARIQNWCICSLVAVCVVVRCFFDSINDSVAADRIAFMPIHQIQIENSNRFGYLRVYVEVRVTHTSTYIPS